MKTVIKSGDVESVVAAVVSEMEGCIFIVYCADDRQFAQISSELRKRMPKTQMIGTTGYMFHENGCFDTGISAMGFTDDEVEVYVGSLRRVDTCPIKYLPGLIWSVKTIDEKYKNNICLEFTSGSEEKVVSTMKVTLETVGMRLIGGTPGNTTEGQEKKVACNGKVLTNSAVYAVIGSKMGKIEVMKENLFHVREKSHTVTRVSKDCRTIYEIDGRKAMDVYEEELGYRNSNVEEGIFKNPLSRIVGADNYITAIFSFNQDRSISVYKNIQKNDMIAFTNMDENFENYIEENMNAVSRNNHVVGMISLNCILRYRFFEKNAFIEKYAGLMNSTANGHHLGMIVDGQQYIEQHVNQSMVCAVFTRDN